MQQQEDPQAKKQETKLRQAIAYKIMVTLFRTCLYVAGYHFRELMFSPSYISIFSSLGVFALLELLYWYRYCKEEDKKEYSKLPTLLLHASCLANLLGIGFTFKYTDIKPSSIYFFFEIGLLFNYALSIVYLCRVYLSPVVENLETFLQLHEPIDSSISYLCVGLYIGSFFDALSFYKESSLIFCTLTLGLILYLIVQFLKSRGVARFRQAFTSE